MGKESDNKGLPWSWVIEALARSELVDVGLLYELSPQLVGESGMAAREASALRCLEGLCASPIRVNVNLNDSQFHFDPTQTCQDVLSCVWEQTGHLQTDVPEELKWSIHSFVKHKRVAFPSCTLALLKNMILEGRHAFLEEFSGLNIPSNCSGDPVPPGSTHLKEVDRCSPSPEIDDQLGDIKNPNASSGHSKSGTDGCCIDDHTQEIDSASYDLNNLAPTGKKRKLEERDSVSSDGLENNIGNQTRGVGDDMQGIGSASYDLDNVGPPGKKRKLQEHDSVFPNGVENNIANQTRGVEPPVKTATGQAKTSTQSYDLPQMSPDNGGCLRHQIFGNMSKATLSSSHCELNEVNEDSIELTDTEVDFCMKCNKGGQLLSCCGNTCPLLFHESCLGGFVSFHDHSNFYCPICTYGRAVSDYVKAKEKVSLARKALTLFIGGGF